MRRRSVLTAAAAVLLGSAVGGGLTGCSGEEKAPAADPADALATAKKHLDEATGVTLALTSAQVPPKVNGVTSAAGEGLVSASEPKFKGTIGATVKGITGTVDLIVIGDQAWMKFFTPGYAPVDLADLGAPNPATLFDPDRGLSTLLTSTTGPVAGGDVREGKEVLRQVSGTLPGQKVKDLLALGAAGSTFDVTYGIADNGELRTATIVGPFYEGATSTYTLVLTDYGKTVAITRP